MGEPLEQHRAGVRSLDGLSHRAKDGTGIETLFKEERGRAGDFIAVDQGVLNRRCPAPSRK